MPTPPTVDKCVRIDMHHTQGDDPSLSNRTYWLYTGSNPTVSNMNDLAGFVEGFWATNFAPLCDTQTHLVEIVCTDLTSPTASRGTWVGSTAGTRGGTYMPVNDCALLNFVISRRYRGGKPRIYAPWGVQGDLVDNQHWSSTFVGTVQSEYTAFHGTMIGQGFGSCAISEQVNVSFYSGFVAAENPVTKRYRNIPTYRDAAQVDQIGSWALNPIVGSQRRRLRV